MRWPKQKSGLFTNKSENEVQMNDFYFRKKEMANITTR